MLIGQKDKWEEEVRLETVQAFPTEIEAGSFERKLNDTEGEEDLILQRPI